MVETSRRDEIRLLRAKETISNRAPSKAETVYLPNDLCSLFLPRHRLPLGVPHKQRAGKWWLSMEPGVLDLGGGPEIVPLPFGATGRLALIHINTLALRRGTGDLDVGESAADFLRQAGIGTSGTYHRNLREALHGFASASITLLQNGATVKMTVASGSVVRADRWCVRLVLSSDFLNLVKRSAPLDVRALAALKGSCLSMDLYTWLATRLCHIDKPAGTEISWSALAGQFIGFSRAVDLAKEVRRRLPDVFAVYPAAATAVQIHRDGLKLFCAAPPVPCAQQEISTPITPRQGANRSLPSRQSLPHY